MRRLVDALQVAGVGVSVLLFAVGSTSRTTPAPLVSLGVGAHSEQGEGSLSWPVAIRMERSSADLFLAVRVTGLSDARNDVEVLRCDDGTSRCDRPIASRVVPEAVHDTTILVGRIGSVDPGTLTRLRVVVSGQRTAPLATGLTVNATPCTAARATQLWTVLRTRSVAEPNTVTAMQQCATRPAPWVPVGLLVWTSTLALRVADHRRRIGRR